MSNESETPAPVPTEAAAPSQPVQVQVQVATPPVNPLSDPKFIDGLFKEYAEVGDLKPESYEALAKAGIPKEIVKDYASSRVAAQKYEEYQAKEATSKLIQECGGQEAVNAALSWAQNNLGQTDIDAINQQLASPSVEARITALRGLQSRAQVTSTVAGKSGGATAAFAYDNEAQMHNDMAQPKYHTDPAFRAEVDARLKAAVSAGKISLSNVFSR